MSKVIRCSMYVNVGRMPVRLKGELLEEVDYFKYLGSQVAADVVYRKVNNQGMMRGIKSGEC